ncbi:MAG: SEC-C metal-binding domain-containing protein, partial [Dehalococcoidia bacterium]
VQYDDVMNAQPDLIYTERHKILEGANLKENMAEMINTEVESAFDAFASHEDPADWDQEALLTELGTIFTLPAHFTQAHLQTLQAEDAVEEAQQLALQSYEQKEQELSSEKMRTLERLVLLGTIDRLWVYHLTALDEMRQGIGLAGYGGRDPLVEFKREAHDMWAQLTDHIRQNVVRRIFHVTLAPLAAPQPQTPPRTQKGSPGAPAMATSGATASGSAVAVDARAGTATVHSKVGRNDPCPCGSGKKYKKCCGSGGVAV